MKSVHLREYADIEAQARRETFDCAVLDVTYNERRVKNEGYRNLGR